MPTKAELVELAIDGGLTKVKANAMKKDELEEYLERSSTCSSSKKEDILKKVSKFTKSELCEILSSRSSMKKSPKKKSSKKKSSKKKSPKKGKSPKKKSPRGRKKLGANYLTKNYLLDVLKGLSDFQEFGYTTTELRALSVDTLRDIFDLYADNLEKYADDPDYEFEVGEMEDYFEDYL